MLYLGYANGWGKNPPKEYLEHEAKSAGYSEEALAHRKQVSYSKLGECLYEYSCKECNIHWKVDSSG